MLNRLGNGLGYASAPPTLMGYDNRLTTLF